MVSCSCKFFQIKILMFTKLMTFIQLLQYNTPNIMYVFKHFPGITSPSPFDDETLSLGSFSLRIPGCTLKDCIKIGHGKYKWRSWKSHGKVMEIDGSSKLETLLLNVFLVDRGECFNPQKPFHCWLVYGYWCIHEFWMMKCGYNDFQRQTFAGIREPLCCCSSLTVDVILDGKPVWFLQCLSILYSCDVCQFSGS